MKKEIYILVLSTFILISLNSAKAQQWSPVTTTTDNIWNLNFAGKVGVGATATTNLTKKFEIWDGGAGRFTFSASSCTSGYEVAHTIDNTGYKINVTSSIRDYRIAIGGTDRFKISTSGNVGIGTTANASYPLDVNGKIHTNNDIFGSKVLTFQDDARFSVTTATVPTLTNSPFSMPKYGIATPNASSSAELWLAGDAGIRLFTHGSETPAVNILANGNVGIGTITPNAKLESVTGVNAYPATANTTQTGAALRLRGGDNAVLDFGMNSINTWIQATDQSNLAQKYNIILNPNGGNVGIGTGTTTPGAKLDVAGELAIGSGSVNLNTTKMFLRNPSGKTWAISSGANMISENRFSIYNWTDNSAAPFFQIDNSGNVGIGTGTAALGAKLDVVGNARISSDLEVDGRLIVKSIDAQNSYGSFHVGGSSSSFYPILFTVTGVAGISSLGKLSIYIDDVHANGDWSGSFHSDIEFISSNYGNMPTKIVKFTYLTGGGKGFSDPIGDIIDGSTQSGNSQLVVWLRGGGTYQWSAPSDSRVTVMDANTDGTTKVSASGTTLNITNTQSALVLKAKNNTYSQNSGFATDGNGYFGGNVGIGITDPKSILDVNGEIRTNLNGKTSNLRMVCGGYATMLRNDGANTYMLLTNNGDTNGGWNTLRPLRVDNSTGDIYFADGKFQVTHNTGNIIAAGKIGIGLNDAATKLAASPPEELLTVNGTIHAKEVKVDLTGSLADYVFDDSYKLMPLQQVESYVKENKHLPEIQSAAEVSKNGLSMGEMQNKLLQKVEELTLYVIEQQKQIEELKKHQK